MNADVEKAVEQDWSVALENAGLLRAMSQLPGFSNASYMADQLVGLCADHRVMAKALRDQEAEIANLRSAGQKALRANMGLRARAEKADALLRDCVGNLFVRGDGGRVLGENTSLTDRITAHLGGEQ